MLGGRHGRWSASAAAAVLTGAAVVLLCVSGCAGEGTQGSRAAGGGEERGGDAPADAPADAPEPGKVVRGAADVLAEQGTSGATTSMLTDSGGTRVSIDGKGVFDYRKRVGQLTVRLPQGGPDARAGERRPITELVVPGALYMKHRGAGVPADKWVRLDVARLSDGNLVTNGATDPATAAELLRGARQVTYEGERTLGARDARGAPGDMGLRVHHFHGTLRLSAAAAAAPDGARKQLAAAAKGLSADAVPFDAYIDGQGRLRKVRHRFTFAGGAGGHAGGTKVSSTTWFHEFGIPVQVEMPEPGDIYSGTIAAP